MKAIQFLKDSSEAGSAEEVELPRPTPAGHDILVKVEAVGLNPVDYKVRPGDGDAPKTLGFDAAGDGEIIDFFAGMPIQPLMPLRPP